MTNQSAKRPRLSHSTAVLMALAAALTLSIAVATAVAAEQTIDGCYSKNNGQLRVVEAPNQCKKGETPISWN